ncbi:MAG: phosphodiesterase [Pseudomonas orientalis]|nr:phosphodiesterase [Pseudomonas orientalis]
MNPDAVLLVQLSDSHLFADADVTLLGMNTRESLQRVIDLVREQQPHIDLVLATGDLSQDGTLASYQQFRDMTAPMGAPARWLAGNHDEPQIMADAAVHSDLLEPVVDVGNWRITLLDSAVPGSVPGYLQDQQLQLLVQALSEAPNRHHLVCLHHHPVSIGCAWMEPIGLRNPDALFAVLDRFPQVKAVLWGHVHQEIDDQRNGVRLLASPSTCIQFAPGSDDFQVSDQAPGYRWLRLRADGRLETGVERVKNFAFTVDYGSNGY